MSERKTNSIKNIAIGLTYQLFTLIFNFVTKTLLIKILGEDILGLNSLFSYILTFFSFTELGVGTVLIFALYKPLKEGDNKKVCAYLNYYKKLYNVFALCIICFGAVVASFLPKIVSSDIVVDTLHLYIYYALFVIDTAVSYLFAYKQAILLALEKDSTIKIFYLLSLIFKSGMRIGLLFVYPNYTLYISFEILSFLLCNILIKVYVDKKYPQYSDKNISLLKEEKDVIRKSLENNLLYKLGFVVLSNTFSVVVSIMISTVVVGKISNYNVIITAVTGVIVAMSTAIFASVGNIAQENDNDKMKLLFNSIQLAFHYISSFCAITMFVVFNDFIMLWLKDETFVLDKMTVLLMCGYFYLQNIFTPINIYRENYGLYGKVKYLFLLSALINIALSILLCYFFGLAGVFASMIISRLLIVDTLEPQYILNEVFHESSKTYHLKQLFYFALTLLGGGASYALCMLINSITVWTFILKVAICFVVVSVVFFAGTFKLKEQKYMRGGIKNLVQSKRQKKLLEK